jgi:hypothetical protein
MPGVVISTAVRTGPSSTTVRESSQLFVVGLAERGPSNEAVLVESLQDFEFKFGEYISTSYLHPTIETFFEEGGTQAYVARVVGTGASAGTKVISGVLSASATTALTLDAVGEGTWSSGLTVTVEHVVANTSFRVKLFYNGTLIYNTGTVTTVAQAAGRINTNVIASKYVLATPASPDSGATVPAVITASAFSAGAAGSAVTEQERIDALDLFNDALGNGAVCIPDAENTVGNTTYTTSEALIAHANSYNRIAILHSAESDDSTEVKAKVSSLQAEDGAEHAALYYPWVSIPTTVNGINRLIPPDGYVAAKRAIAHNGAGPHIPAAGVQSASRFVNATELDINKVTGDDLDENSVNAIRVIQNSVRIYGARSISSDTENFRYIVTQDIVNSVVVDAQRSLEELVFSSIDGRNTIYSDISSRLTAICARLKDLGALFEARSATGALIDLGYTVRCDASLNPISQLAGGTVKAKIGLRTSTIGDKIEVEITKSNLTASVVQ